MNVTGYQRALSYLQAQPTRGGFSCLCKNKEFLYNDFLLILTQLKKSALLPIPVQQVLVLIVKGEPMTSVAKGKGAVLLGGYFTCTCTQLNIKNPPSAQKSPVPDWRSWKQPSEFHGNV